MSFVTPVHRLALISAAGFLVLILGINIALNVVPIDRTPVIDGQYHPETPEWLTTLSVVVPLGVLVLLLMGALAAQVAKKPAIAKGRLLGSGYVLVVFITSLWSFRHLAFLYLPVFFGLLALAGHLFRVDGLRRESLLLVLVSGATAIAFRLLMLLI